jgi:hypothetical protein
MHSRFCVYLYPVTKNCRNMCRLQYRHVLLYRKRAYHCQILVTRIGYTGCANRVDLHAPPEFDQKQVRCDPTVCKNTFCAKYRNGLGIYVCCRRISHNNHTL